MKNQYLYVMGNKVKVKYWPRLCFSLSVTFIAVFLNLFLPRGTLGRLYEPLVAPLDAKHVLKIVIVIVGGTPDTISWHPG